MITHEYISFPPTTLLVI